MKKSLPIITAILLLVSLQLTIAEGLQESDSQVTKLVEDLQNPSESDQTWIEKKRKLPVLNDAMQKRILDAIPESLSAQAKSSRRILVFYRCDGFVHHSIPFANYALQKMGEQTGAYQADFADSFEVFTEDNLSQYDAILFNNTTRLIFPTLEHKDAFKQFVLSGKGLIGIHAAADNFGKYQDCVAMMGGIFDSHPWRKDGTWAFRLDDPKHVINSAFGGKGFWHKDEVYRYKENSFVGPGKLRLLVSLDMTKEEVSKQVDEPQEVAVSWVQRLGEGRLFYTNFGHRNETFRKPLILRHIMDGIQYALGDLEAEDQPTAEAEKVEPALAPDEVS